MSLAIVLLAPCVSLPGPSRAEAAFRFAAAEISLVPADPSPSTGAKMEIALIPVEGFEWHDSPLAEAKLRCEVPPGWRTEPEEVRFPPGPHSARRMVSIRLVPDKAAERQGVPLVLKFRYSVRDASGAVFIENAELVLSLPAEELPGVHPVERTESSNFPVFELASIPDADMAVRTKGNPLLPAAFLALSTLLLLVGLAVWIRKRRI